MIQDGIYLNLGDPVRSFAGEYIKTSVKVRINGRRGGSRTDW